MLKQDKAVEDYLEKNGFSYLNLKSESPKIWLSLSFFKNVLLFVLFPIWSDPPPQFPLFKPMGYSGCLSKESN